jgi:hypothetical protein
MALKKNTTIEENEDSISAQKAKELFKKNTKKKKENKVLTTFSIEPSFKSELEEMFADMGLGWAAGIRFALREYIKKYRE